MEKKCSKCGETKLFSEFHKKSKSANGLKPRCKECIKVDSKVYYEEHQEEINKKTALVYESNKDAWKARMKEWHKKNPWAWATYSAKRRASEIQATPTWLTEEDLLFIKCKYQLSDMRNRNDDKEWHVDHIVPLRGKKVCGLHVPWNLQVIPAIDNLRKGNKFDNA